MVVRATYRPDEVEAYITWAESVMGRFRDELRRWAATDPIVEARVYTEDLLEWARRQASDLLEAALGEIHQAAGDRYGGASVPPRPSGFRPELRVADSRVTFYDADDVDAYVAWVTATIARLRAEIAAARNGPMVAPAAAGAEAERIRAQGRAQAAAIVHDARRRLAAAVTAEQLRLQPAPAPAPAAARAADQRVGAGSRSRPGSSSAPGAAIDPGEPVWARRGRWIRNTGVFLVLFVMYQLFGTSVEADRSQRRLMSAFTRQMGAAPAAAAGSEAAPATTTTTVPPPPLPGDAVAIVKIAKLGIEQAVVEGTSVTDLRKGPGHYKGTPLPGEAGNAGIAGHRTTYGAPFGRLDELVPGDDIIVQTKAGTFLYTVAGSTVVKPGRVDVLYPQGDNRLTLTTCHPKYSARQRYVVWAILSPNTPPVSAGPETPVSPAAPEPSELASSPEEEAPRIVADDSSSFHLGALPPTIFWGLLLLGASKLSRRWGRSWHRVGARVLATPAMGFALLQSFQSLSHLLPANY